MRRGGDYWLGIVCGGAVINAWLLCVLGQWLLVWYCVRSGGEITDWVFCVLGQ